MCPATPPPAPPLGKGGGGAMLRTLQEAARRGVYLFVLDALTVFSGSCNQAHFIDVKMEPVTPKDFRRSPAQACGLHVRAPHRRDGPSWAPGSLLMPQLPPQVTFPVSADLNGTLTLASYPLPLAFPSAVNAKALKPAQGQPPDKAGAGGGGEGDSGWPALRSGGMQQRPTQMPGPQAFLPQWGWTGH